MPSLWAIVEDFPLTPNGKLDVARLTELSTAFGPSLARPHADNATPVPSGEASVGEDEVEQAIAQAWQEVLGHRDFGRYDRFLDIGGDSLQLLRVHAILRRTLTHWPVTMTDLYTRPAIADLASTLRAHANAFNGQNRKSEPQLSLHDGLELRRAPPGLRGDAANPGMERLMIARVGINGLGRIGRGFMRVALAMKNDLDIVAVNDPADNRLIAYLCQYDTLHGIFPEPVQADMHYLRIGDNQIGAFSEADPAAIPWDDFGVDIVVEASGRFANRAAASKHLASGAKRVLIASVAEDADATIIMGVNDDRLDPSRHRIISNSLCTAHCAAVMLKVLHDKFGVNNANMTTLHAYTNRQVLLDNPREDTRLSRSGTVNIIPSATPIARSVALTLPELDGRVDGLAIRIPVRGGSLVNLVAHLNTRVTEREINAAFRKDADGPLKRVLDYTEDPIISSDILGSAASCIFDAGLTITQGEYIKIIGWYDNEWGYCNRLADLARLTASQIG